MALTPEQLTTFAAALAAETDPVLVSARDSGATPLIANWYNDAASPEVVVWRTSVPQDEIMQNGFDWVRVDNLAVGKARIWEWMFTNESRSFNPSKSNVRAGIEEVWKGTAADLAVRAAIYVHCKRPATRIEAMFAAGAGTTESPSTMAFEGNLSEYDVTLALAL